MNLSLDMDFEKHIKKPRMAVFSHNLLTPFTSTFVQNVKNSFELFDMLTNITNEEGYELVWLDVTSLFTNIPK